MEYPNIPNTIRITTSLTKTTSASAPLPSALLSPPMPTPSSKSIFAFWLTGINTLPPYLLRNVLNWHARFSPVGWTIYVLDNVPSSPLNVSNYIDTKSQNVVPEAFTFSTLDGEYKAQHTSDLIRYPLLLRYGGVYLDVGILQFGDLDWLWTSHISNPTSPYDLAGFTMGDAPDVSIVNFALMAGPNNPLVARAHSIVLKVWEGRTNTVGTHRHPLMRNIPLMSVPRDIFQRGQGEDEMVIKDQSMTDYAIQIQCMGLAQKWVDDVDGWDGPKYVREKTWLLSMMNGAYLYEQLTAWNSAREFELLSLPVPKPGEETEDQKVARSLVEKVVGESWCIKLGHGQSAKLFGAPTLGMLWRKVEGSDCQEGTYAGWLRWAELNLKHERELQSLNVPVYEPIMRGRLDDPLWSNENKA